MDKAGERSGASSRPWPRRSDARCASVDRFRGCLLAGAAGDALGAAVEFMSRAQIHQRFGADGITDYAPEYGGRGRITDDTQMTLFTAEGLLRAWVRGCMRGITTYTGVTANAYLRWLQTQGERPRGGFHAEPDGWLFDQPQLHSRRAPGHTCLSALHAMAEPGDPASNDSKGCGGVMRSAPVGLFVWRKRTPHVDDEAVQEAFELGTELAALTHGHPSGALSSGAFAVLILALADGATLPEAVGAGKARLGEARDGEETLRAIERAEALAGNGVPAERAIDELGQGWVAEEALAIAIYCTLVAPDLEQGVVLAVNHDGDSDSTGSITGNLLGIQHGVDAIPPGWLEPLELREVIAEVAEDLCTFRDWPVGMYGPVDKEGERIIQKYPGA